MTRNDQDMSRHTMETVGFTRPRRSASVSDQVRRLQILMSAGLAMSIVIAVTVISIGFAKADGVAVAVAATDSSVSAALGHLLPLLALIAGCTLTSVGLVAVFRARRTRRIKRSKQGRRPGMTFV